MRKKMAMKVMQEMQAKKEAEMVQKIIEKVRMSQKSISVDKIMTREMKERVAMRLQVKAECKAQGEDVDRRGYTKHYAATS